MPMRIDPWGEAISRDYARLMEEFGISSFDDLADQVPDPSHLVRRKIIFGHRDFGRVLKAIEKGNSFVTMTGLMPSGRMHLGHKLVVDQLIWYQKHGADIFLCVADLEAHTTRKLTLEQTRKIAIEEYLVNFQALGLDLRKCNLYFQSQSDAVRNLAFTLGTKINYSMLKAIYGFGGTTSASHMFYPTIDISDILHPQLKEFGGPRPSVIPVGVDQDPHLRLARDIAARFKDDYKFVAPSSTYHRLMWGLDGGDKMSSSKPETAIFLTDTPKDAELKIKDAFTGGQPTASEQRELGGDPSRCVIYEMCVYHLMMDDTELLQMREECKAGKIICGECKKKALDLLKKFLSDHAKKRKEAVKVVEKLLK